jgi:drug/metabolite transporter (DMT)-like permease
LHRAGDERKVNGAVIPAIAGSGFVTFGAYFSILKYLQTYYLDERTYHSYVMSAFLFAFLSSLIIGAVKGVFSWEDLSGRQFFAGLTLGGVNYLAIYSLIKVLALKGWQSSQLFPIYSVGVVAASALLAVLFFRERLSRQKTLGLALGVAAVALLNR